MGKIREPEVRRTSAILVFDEGESDGRDSEFVRRYRDTVHRQQRGFRETTLHERGRAAGAPNHRRAATNQIENPVIEPFEAKFSGGLELGTMPGDRRAAAAHVRFPGTAMSCDGARNASIGGALDDIEHGHVLQHRMLRKTMRGPIGGGLALVPPAGNGAATGTSMDALPGNKYDAWSSDHSTASRSLFLMARGQKKSCWL